MQWTRLAVASVLLATTLAAGLRLERVEASPTIFPGSGPSLCAGNAAHTWQAEHNRVLLSTNGGITWHVSFRGRFQQPSRFAVGLGCAGSVAWALFVGRGGGMNQQPYVLYRTTDGGARWIASMEEGYFGSAYPDAHTQRSLGAYSGPFTVVSSTTAYFLGETVPVGPRGRVYVSGTTDGGRSWRRYTIPCLSALKPVTIQFRNRLRGWVAGTCSGRSTVMATANGGRTWIRHRVA